MFLTVKQIKNEAEDILSIIFEKPAGFQFYPAQFIDVAVDVPNPDNSRIYSLSSSPTEEDLMITLKRGVSDHKKKLQTLKPGDKVTITHPSGTYTLDESVPAVMLAGGVGIAPYRSMIKFAADNELNTNLTLIYSNSNDNFVFKKELDDLQKSHKHLHIIYRNTKEKGRIGDDDLKFYLRLLEGLRDPIYYLAGPPSFVEEMGRILNEIGIDRVDVRLDSFDGY